jgi:hypothetical protein
MTFNRAPLHFVGLELAVAAAFALTLAHALRERRRGDGWPLVQWLTALCYGVLIELVTYNYWDNFDHGQFTVQLYHHKLPLYVVLLYPAFHYTGLKLVEARNLPRVTEALVVGLCIMLIDVPFDTAGPDAGWWRWSTKDPNMAVRWLGVPITSYYWYLLFGALYAAILRALRPRLGRRAWAPLVAPLLGAAVLVLGVIAFIPFHLLKAVGIPAGAIVAAHIAAVAVLAWRTRGPSASPSLRVPALVLQLYPVLVLGWLRAPDWPLKGAAMATAIAALFALTGSAALSTETAPKNA